MTVMYDSTDPFAIPVTAEMVAGYVDGIYAWSAAGWQRFAGRPQWKIAIFYGTDNGNVLDVEQYDATPAQAPVWVKKRLASGLAPPAILYVNRGNRSAVESALQAAGITASQAALWVATLDGTQTVPAGPYPVVAVQYANSVIAGGHYDLSIVSQFGADTGDTDLTPAQESKLNEIWQVIQNGSLTMPSVSPDNPDNHWWIATAFASVASDLAALKADVAALKVAAAPTDLTATNAKLDALARLVLKIETALRGA